jgi:hypothetical protein
MFRNRSRRFWVTLAVVVAAIVFYFPSLVAYRYTAPPQNVTFLYRPWRSWSFAYTALTVPGDAKLKTSGEALRAAEAIWPGPSPSVDEVRVLFVEENQPYEFTHMVDGRNVTTTIVPPYDFVWQVRGAVGKGTDENVVGLLDYRSGDVLYDVRSDLPMPAPSATPSAGPSTAPSASLSPAASSAP